MFEVQEADKTEETSHGPNWICRRSDGIFCSVGWNLRLVPRSRKAAILLIAGGLGYTLTFMWLSRFEADAMQAAVFGIIPVSIGIGYFIDAVLVQREMRPAA